ncbi:hypothetical protein RP20_CCG025158 [Aedes albopictus]|nr:hypothetical protein RP20_CCG025158 [Aedes albopictus]
MSSSPLSPLFFPPSETLGDETYCPSPTQLSPKNAPTPEESTSPETSPKRNAKRKLSDITDSKCVACFLEVTATISCCGCYDQFCDHCISLLERKCPRCVAKAAAPPKMPPNCKGHDKELAFFCLTCETEICSECILEATDHKRHLFDRLEAVYLEKIAVTDDKVAKIGLQIEEIEKNTEMARKNLDLITAVGDAMLAELQAIHDAAKMEVQEILDEKREELEKRINLPDERKALVKKLQDDIKALGHFGFIKQQERFNEQCDGLLEQCQKFSTDLIDHYDIGCELIPATKMTTYKCNWTEGKQELLNILIDDSTGESWKMSLIKGDTVCLKVAPNESIPVITSHKFKVTTEISNNDISKSLRKRFVIQRKMSQFELANVELISTEGYLEDDTMLFHIAIEPLNVIEAYDHYKDKVAMLRSSVEQYKNLLSASKGAYDALKTNTDCLKSYSVGYFALDYGGLQRQTKNGFVSPNIVDFNGNEWKMEVKFERDEFNKILLSTYVFPARFVNSSEHARRCAYFIELMHSNPDEIVRGYAENLFEENGLGRGWKGFIERMRVLNDVGFLRNGKVWFRYGVRPSA